MKSKHLCLFLIIPMFLVMACKKEEPIPVEPTPAPTPEPAIVMVEQMPVHSDSWEDILAEEVAPPEEEAYVVSATTGREIDVDRVFRPVFVCLDNATGSRPLYGIMNADIVYEAPSLENNGTRLLALYSDESPALAGPIGNAAASDASLQKEWGGGMLIHAEYLDGVKDADFTHPVSNSGDAETYFSEPEDAAGVCVDLAQLAAALYTEQSPEAGVRFLMAVGYPYENAAKAAKFRIPFGGGKGERVEYAFDSETGQYTRYQSDKNGGMEKSTAMSWNEETAAFESVPLLVDSVIVQYVESVDGALTLVGTGACEFFVNGLRLSGTWTRESAEATTLYCLEDGSVVTIAAGRTWIALQPADAQAQVL